MGGGVPVEEPESSDQPEPDFLDVVANALADSSTSAYDLAVNTLGQAINVTTSASAFNCISVTRGSSPGYEFEFGTPGGRSKYRRQFL